jgi:hypothetical protein
MQSHATVEEIIDLARRLSPLEKLRLIGQLAPDLEAALSVVAAAGQRRSLRGLLKGSTVGEKEIEQMRREMWEGFGREVK